MMGDDMLSQDEIDALLRGSDDAFDEEFVDDLDKDNFLSLMEKDALGEIGNISFGSSATALSTLLNQKVEITTPNVDIIFKSKLAAEFPQPYVAIHVSYTKGFSGINLLVIKKSDAAIIADLMLGGNGRNPDDLLGEIQLSAVQEAMNQMMGSAATSMSTIFNKRVDISPPSIDILDIAQGEGTERLPDDNRLVKISFRLKIGELIDSNIMQLLPLDFAKSLVDELLNPKPDVQQEVGATMSSGISNNSKPQQAERGMQNQISGQYNNNVNMNQPSFGATYTPEQGTAFSKESDSSKEFIQHQVPPQRAVNQVYQNSAPQHFGSEYSTRGSVQPNVQPAVFSNFETSSIQDAEARNLNILLDIPLQVTVELGRTKRSVKEILGLSPGSIIELDKLAGEPVDIHVNNRLIAKGEVVVIDENFGVRVTDIISQTDRISKLR